jgi:PiT family inorganic phosphate transporter
MWTLAVVAAAIAFALAAGFNDGGNLLAISASSRTMTPSIAYLLVVLGVCLGPLAFGTAVARTTGAGIADFHSVGPSTLFAALAGALVTVTATYAARVPTSLSVALFSSMVGALWAGPGFAAIHWIGLEKVAVSMTASVVVGVTAGALIYRCFAWLLARVHRSAGERIVKLQFAAVVLLAMGYGANDMEKSAGLIAAAVQPAAFVVPAWTLAAAALGFAAGMAIGGVRVAKTVGGKLFSIRAHHALAAESASAATVIGAALLGGPLSTTDTSAAALVGVGAAVNPRAIRWQVVGHIALAWVVTIPSAAAAGALAESIVRLA